MSDFLKVSKCKNFLKRENLGRWIFPTADWLNNKPKAFFKIFTILVSSNGIFNWNTIDKWAKLNQTCINFSGSTRVSFLSNDNLMPQALRNQLRLPFFRPACRIFIILEVPSKEFKQIWHSEYVTCLTNKPFHPQLSVYIFNNCNYEIYTKPFRKLNLILKFRDILF